LKKTKLDLKAEIEKIFEQHRRHFFSSEEYLSEFGTQEVLQLAKDLREEFGYLHRNIFNNRENIGKDEADDLNILIADKLAIGANTVGKYDWWWKPAIPASQQLLREVQRLLEKAAPKKIAWPKWLGYGWKVVLQLVYLGLVLSVISIASTKFETIALSVLVLTYNAAKSVHIGIGFSLAYQMAALQTAYGEIGRALNLKISTLPEKETKDGMQRSLIYSFIQGIPLSLGSLWAIWKIVDAVFFML
jgi:hypothetical protein